MSYFQEVSVVLNPVTALNQLFLGCDSNLRLSPGNTITLILPIPPPSFLPHASWGTSLGTLTLVSYRPRMRNITMLPAPHELCLYHRLSDLTSLHGGTLRVCPAMVVFTGPSSSWRHDSSGPLWRRMYENTWRLVPPALALRRLTPLLLVSCFLCPLRSALGPISLWTLLLVYHPHMDTRWFSPLLTVFQSLCFISLPQLPTATETAEILVDQVFRHHGIPTDIVSDVSPQIISQVWKAYCSALGATARMMSDWFFY